MSELEIYKGMVKKMKDDEIKEILDDLLFTTTLPNVSIKLNKEKLNQLKDYITNLQQQLHQASLDIQELTERDIECPSWCDKLTNLQQENQRLKRLAEKDYTELNIAEMNATIYKSRCEKALKLAESYDLGKYDYSIPAGGIMELKDILNGRSDE